MKMWLKTTRFFLFLALLMPLLVGLQSYIFPFVVPKILFFRTIVEFALLSFLLLVYREPSYLLKRGPLLVVSGFFVFAALISGIFGIDSQQSWWGNFERMEGVFTLVHCFVYLYLLCAVFRSRESWRTFLTALTGVSVLVILTGVIQRFSDSSNPFITLGGGSRVYGTLGNYIYYGQYSFFTFWMAAILAYWSETKAWRYVYAGVMLLSVWGIYLSGSRGPLVAWLASLVAFGGIMFFFSGKRVKIASSALVGSVVFLLGLAIFGNIPWIMHINVLGGLREIATMGGTASTRLMAWDIAWKGFLDRPILGWGWGNYYAVFDKYFDPRFLEHGWSETWFDHAHNQYFDMLSTTGIVGTLAYLSIFITATAYLIRALRQKKMEPILFASIVSLLVGHAVNNIFVFEHPSSYLLFFVLLGIIQVETSPREMIQKSSSTLSLSWRIGGGVVAFFTLIGLYTGNYLGWRSNLQDRQLQVDFQADPAKAMPALQQLAERAGPYRRDVRNDVGLAALRISRPAQGSQLTPVYVSVMKQAIDLEEKNYTEYPFDTRRGIVLVDLYKNLLLVGEDVGARMEEILTHLKTLSPKRQQIYYYWAEVRLQSGQYEEAISFVKETLDPRVRVYAGLWLLAKIEGSRAHWIDAKKYLDEARANGFVPDAQTQPLVDIIEHNQTAT